MRIALVAHNGKKDDMVALATEFASQLRQHTLMATGTTDSQGAFSIKVSHAGSFDLQ